MSKSPEAFRTISEVSDWLDTPAHVLRFWESKFSQIKPVKRAGGRRYYRPEDMALLAGIKRLLHEQGMTIKGVQKLLREQGIRHVVAIGEGADAGLVIDVVAQPAAPPATISSGADDADDPTNASGPEPSMTLPPPAAPLPMHAGRPAHLPPLEIEHRLPIPPERGQEPGQERGQERGVEAEAPPAPAPAMPGSASHAGQPTAPPPAAIAAKALADLPPAAAAFPGILSRIVQSDHAHLATRRRAIATCRDRLLALLGRMADDRI